MTRTGKLPKLLPILERDFQRTVIELAEICGWRSYHVANVKGRLRARSSIGFPDLVLTRDGCMIAAELKRAGRDPTDAQRQWLHALGLVPGVTAVCWRPADWPEIEATLTRRAATLAG